MMFEMIVMMVKKYGCESIVYIYNELMIWYEFVLDMVKLVKKEGFYNFMIINGYINEEFFREFVFYIDVMNIDIKVFNDEFYMKIVSVLSGELSRRMVVIVKKEFGIYVELIYFIILMLNDKEEEIRVFVCWVVEEMGDDMLVYFFCFFLYYKFFYFFLMLVEMIEMVYCVVKEEGLKFVYIGNVFGYFGEYIYCLKCEKFLIVCYGFEIVEYNVIDDGRCGFCGEFILIVGIYIKKRYFGMWW